MRAVLHVVGLFLAHTAMMLAIGTVLLCGYAALHFLMEALR